jgi:outer membrane protein assembly factor BamB
VIRFAILLVGLLLGCTAPDVGVPKNAVIWHVRGHAGHGRPAMDDSTVYFIAAADSHVVHAFDLSSGRTRWSAPTGAHGGIFSFDGCLVAVRIVACGDITDIVGFDQFDGHVVWRFRPVGAQPAVLASAIDSARTTIYAPTQEGSVYAIDAATGQLRWLMQLAFAATVSTQVVKVVDGGTDVVFASYTTFARRDSGGVVAINKSDGTIRWLVPLPSAADSNAGTRDLVLWNSYLIASVDDGRIVALDRVTGQRQWTLPGVGVTPAQWLVPNAPVGSDLRTLIVTGSTLLAASANAGWVVAYDLSSHSEGWRVGGDLTFGPGFMQADGDARSAYFRSTSSGLYALSLDGAKSLSMIASGFTTPPALAADRLVIGALDGYYAIKR